MALGIKLKNLTLFYPRVLKFSHAYHGSAYDASHLALAEEDSTIFITVDRTLFCDVKKELKRIKWQGDI